MRFRNGGYIASRAFGGNHPQFSPAVIAAYQQAWAKPGARRGMFNWYRAVRKAPPERLESPRITVPTLLIWGKRDQVFEPAIAEESIALCDDGRLHLIDNATHWVQHEAADEVNQQLLDWLKG